jgi:hypothetical protein
MQPPRYQLDTPRPEPRFKAEEHVRAFLAGGYLNPENEISGRIQCMGSAALAPAARGELDLNALAIIELAACGLDDTGTWVGFDKARLLASAKLAQKGFTR